MSTAYPTPGISVPVAPGRPPSARTAETLVLVALILQLIGAAALVIGIGVLLGVSVLSPFPTNLWIALIAVSVGAVALLFLYFAYGYSYRRIQRGEYAAAEAPTLILGILSLFLGVIPGILYLVGYAKLTDAVREQRAWTSPPGPGVGVPAMSAALVACRACGRVYPLGGYGFCPACGQKLGA